ncbi:hypothetical protein BDA96_07G042200 [Sorghum bicolor]|uniref:BPTI/Kunitz inhibitor domain-containing protein n=2 Tax=Sorghum bicolor TaxID=4558 RepID=A0A921QIQ4_SORBI|nr:hypothetical protein BDA96_07G042200 [Sorghum bicolor]KXG24423.1 hypothetical protein SORBI_3007G040000 [Sorghum bicolor]
MAKCQKHVSIQGLWLLSMVLLASSVVGARIINGQTKEDINTKSVNINTTKSASYIGSGGVLNQGPCVVKNHFFWCGNIGYPTMSECLRNCRHLI